ncbi:MAG TPA: hypothetical protein PKE12_00100 [Kiritimatiellia bacterium]|nr:hypothetical protein [Kiritimatiellia bacterium]
MKMKRVFLFSALAAVGLFAGAGCDWSSNSTSLNTSQGAGININFSGVYNGNINGRAVDRTSAGTISSLTIRQTGNRVEVIDSQGSRYEGSVGSPGLVSNAREDGTYPPGAELVQSQISWAGKDGVAQKDVEFVGIIHAISVDDVKSTTETKVISNGSSSNQTTTDQQGKTQTFTTNNGKNTTITEILTVGVPGDPFYSQTVTTTVIDNQTGAVISRETTTTGNTTKSSSSEVTVETINTYAITEANVQYRLEGTWIEKDSPIVSRVDAISRGTFGIITITTQGSQEGGTGGSGSTE